MENNRYQNSSKEKLKKSKIYKQSKKASTHQSNYEAALKITFKQKMDAIKESNKRLDEYPETAFEIKEFINSLVVEKINLKKYFSKEELKLFKKLGINLKIHKIHTIFEIQSLEKDLLYFYSNDRFLPKNISKKDLESLLDPISKIINYEKNKLKQKK